MRNQFFEGNTYKKAKKRFAHVEPLDSQIHSNYTVEFNNCYNIFLNDWLESVFKTTDKDFTKLVKLKMEGYTNSEIAKKNKYGASTFYRIYNNHKSNFESQILEYIN